MSEVAKHLDRAEKHLHKGRPDAALNEYLQVLQEDPGNEPAAQAAADLCLTLGRGADALLLLRQIFERQLNAGQPAALGTYKKLSRLTSIEPDQHLKMARAVESTNRREAHEAYLAALRGFTEAGRKAEALATLEGIVSLELTVDWLRKLAQVADELHDPRRAVSALLKAAELETKENPAGALALYERAYSLDRTNSATALAYAHAVLANETPENAAKAAAVLQPLSSGPQSTSEARALYGRALLLTRRTRESVPFLWELFEQNPEQIDSVMLLLRQLLDAQQTSDAVALARRVEEHQLHAGRLRKFAGLMREIGEQHKSSLELLEYLVDLFNAANCEHDYCRTLLQLFELYYAEGNFLKAGECLDRAAEVDPYEDGHQRRLDLLRGKLDNNRLRAIASRLLGAVTTADEQMVETADAVSEQEPTVLEDLMLQAEIFLQYSLRSRAAERLERIRKIFPGEEHKNEKLRDLYVAAGIMQAPNAFDATGGGPESAPRAPADDTGIDFARANEITRNIYRQGTVKSVLFTAVNEAGRQWNASRCVAVLCTPGKPPSIALEYCASGTKPSDVHAIVKLVAFLQPLVIAHGPLMVPGDAATPGVAALKRFASHMGIRSMLAMPLIEGDEHVGLLLLAQGEKERKWRSTDVAVLKTITDQTVLAVSNVRLRSLVKNLAITEEKSGLLKRSSYLDVLLSETRRAVEQKSVVSVLLLNFGKGAELSRQMGEASLDAMIQQLGQLVCSNIRQNDVAIRYDLTTIALVLADTGETNALLAVEKLRKLLTNARVPSFTAGICEAVIQPDFDPVDIVTELINRVEAALHMAMAEGGNKVQSLAPEFYTSLTAS